MDSLYIPLLSFHCIFQNYSSLLLHCNKVNRQDLSIVKNQATILHQKIDYPSWNLGIENLFCSLRTENLSVS